MAWDASRPVPWERLIREWLLYVAIMAALFLLVLRQDNLLGVFAGLLASGPLYLMFGYVLAKFGYQRKSWKQLRAESTDRAARSDEPAPGPKPKPAPTKRTGGGSGRPGGSRSRRR